MSAKIAEFTPMASARVMTATMVNPGVLTSCRNAKRKSWIIELAFSVRCGRTGFWIHNALLRRRRGRREKRFAAGDVFQVPQARGAVAAGGGEIRTGRGKFDGPEGIAVAAQNGDALSRFVIPQTRGPVPAYGYDARPVGSEARGPHGRRVSFQSHDPLFLRCVPNFRCLVRAGGDEERAVGLEGNIAHRLFVMNGQ